LAHDIVRREVKCGRLVRQPCERCGSRRGLTAHHEDYSRPLNVRWLCLRCHGRQTRRDLYGDDHTIHTPGRLPIREVEFACSGTYDHAERRDYLEFLLSTLHPRKRFVVEARNAGMTLRVIGLRLGVSHEYVRILLAAATEELQVAAAWESVPHVRRAIASIPKPRVQPAWVPPKTPQPIVCKAALPARVDWPAAKRDMVIQPSDKMAA